MKKWRRAVYHPNLPLKNAEYVTASKAHIDLSREAAADGMVLLKNENSALPLKPGKMIAAVGRGIVDIVKGGGGTGDVNSPFVTSLADGLRKCHVALDEPLLAYYTDDIKKQYAGGAVPGMTFEPAVPIELLSEARKHTDTAVIAISRFSGEGWDRVDSGFVNPEESAYKDMEVLSKVAAGVYPRGDFYLTDGETQLIDSVCDLFETVILVLNIGGIIDLSRLHNDDRIRAGLLMWQGGTDGGTAAAQILTGEVCPSGRLADTFADTLEAYPSTEGFHRSAAYVDYTEDIFVGYRYFETFPEASEHVLYTFGHGLSYTNFEEKLVNVIESPDKFTFEIGIKNTGSVAGKHVTAVYYSAPQGRLGHPKYELAAFDKTDLLQPGECESLKLSVSKQQLASFDDLGKISRNAFVLEKGEYHFFIGCCVSTAGEADFKYTQDDDRVLKTVDALMKPIRLPARLTANGNLEALPMGEETDLNECAFEKLVPGYDDGLMPAQRSRAPFLRHNEFPSVIPLIDVAEGKAEMSDFIRQLSDDDLVDLLGGKPNTGVANTNGIGGIPEYGVPSLMTADGNAGVRINPDLGVYATAWPCQTLIASTWDLRLAERVGVAIAEEMAENNLQIWLAPGANIHRSPICGRNFEYYSEDPYITGKFAAAVIRGVQSQGIAACVKHFACNDKETNRMNSDSRVSMRALREIHLRGFEIAVKEADPWTIMLGYNAVNGYRCAEDHDMITGILRNEWNYDGVVISDWWDRSEHYKQIIAGCDVKMPVGYPDRVKKAMDLGLLTRKDLERCAGRVLRMICKVS